MRPLLLAVLALLALAAPAAAQSPGRTALDYVTVSDGTEIHVSVWYPPGFDDQPARRWPALFEMDGYGGARGPDDRQFWGQSRDFVVVYASVRGTGCSGGQFELFGQRGALDGREVIEDWLVEQPWSNGRVGITGHSYSGLTGFQVAATSPPSVRAVAVSGLIDDLYRGLLYWGGIPNAGFPVLWGAGVRPAGEAQHNLQPQLSDERCRRNFAEHGATAYTPPPDATVGAYGGGLSAAPDGWMLQHSLMPRIGGVVAPTQIGHQWQDEQTGPRGGPVLWEALNPGLPKRLVLSNGRHNPNDPTRTKDAWLRCWVIQDGEDCGATTDPERRVLVHLDSRKNENGSGQQRATPYAASDFPAPETRWERRALPARTYVAASTDHHVTANAGLQPETAGTGGTTFGQDLPTQARWALPIERDTPVAGPITLTLDATITSADTDFFVDVLDHDPATGELRYLQRGLLRASFRRVDEARSDRIRTGPLKGEVFRPYRAYAGPEPVVPGTRERYVIEVFPLGHVFREGHELVLQVHAPPPNDPLSTGTFPPEQTPAVVQVHEGSLLLPVLPSVPATQPAPAPCGRVSGELCLVAPGA